MSYEKQVRAHKREIEKLLASTGNTLEHSPNVIAQNKMIVLNAILQKAAMVCEEAVQAADLQPKDIEAILDKYAQRSAQYGINPELDEIDAMKREIERLTRAVDILVAMRKRGDLSHRLVGQDPRLMGSWTRWIRILEQYKISQDISEKHRESLIEDIESWRSILAGTSE
jgi:hypothetical protein